MEAARKCFPSQLSNNIKEQKFSTKRKFLKRNQYAETKKNTACALNSKYC